MITQFPQWRLRLVSIFCTLIVGILIYRIVIVQIVRHESYRKRADSQWHKIVKWPARRGSILDRHGQHLLALSHRTYSLGITPRDFPKDVEAVTCLARILGTTTGQIKRELAKDSRYVQLGRDLHLNEDEVARLSSLSGVRLDQIQDRLYPFGSIPKQLIGSVNLEGEGGGGIELAFQDVLCGEDGWLRVNRDAKDQTFRLVYAPRKKPRDGHDLYLTIDSRVQAIVDFELEQAVERYHAVRGIAIVIDPFTGEILALSEKGTVEGAHRLDNLALYTTSCIYEPGSVFKLITYSYLLERGKVDPYDVFYPENGVAAFAFGTFRDDHPIDKWLSFKECFVFSSNICTIKAAKDSDPYDFYRYMLRFGFGERTGVDLPAESKGSLNHPSKWSARSLPSISFGHEIGVTPIQVAMAYCAVANGGELFVPKIALKEYGQKGRIVREFPVVKVRRVLTKETAKMLRYWCREVVKKGTGTKASVAGVPVGGKTGTAQKAADGVYQDGKFVASFIGFAPVTKPEIVCLVLLDEPRFPYHWGGESAAIVFRRIVEGINLATDLLCRNDRHKIAVTYDDEKRVKVPSFLRLTPEEALELASDCGLGIHCSGEQGMVYSQIPDPGTFVERGDEVKLLVIPEKLAEKATVRVPDLRGLSIREARRLLLACGLRSRVDGSGVVVSHKPGPGSRLKRTRVVTMMCRPKEKVTYPAGVVLH